jgi:sphingomyelin phosphodiesterase
MKQVHECIFNEQFNENLDSLAPCNLFPTPQVRSDNISVLYQHLADSWINLGLPNDTRQTIERGGFYTTVVRPGLRVISLNMNYCYWLNFWLFINSTDPLGQLQWVNK